ncbi:histone modifying enzyme [Lithospermum erythrorhizon]|uniref:Histone modifying enzyme n=1 Tax=Lithospermum erythrorhizon TaxID=34254 RepID=A0AAV3Q1H7_LITER
MGDIFLFRKELCLVGLHAQSMAGIDYLSLKVSGYEDPVAVSIVSSWAYDDDGNNGGMLIYTGQCGLPKKDGQTFHQKLEGGNLALEKSRHRGNEIRVIRGLKGVISRAGVILPDLTSGSERLPVSLVNDVDDAKGSAYFTYTPTPKYIRPYSLSEPSLSCTCLGDCQSGDVNCPCIQKNEGFLPSSSLGVLLSYPALVHECGVKCACSSNCRNRMTQAGLKVRLEVFKTTNRGWGLGSWDPIRSGGFICPQGNPSHAPRAPFPLVIDAKREGNVARCGSSRCRGFFF